MPKRCHGFLQRIVITVLNYNHEMLVFVGHTSEQDIYESDIIRILQGATVTGAKPFAPNPKFPQAAVTIHFYNGPALVANYSSGPMMDDLHVLLVGTVVTVDVSD